jgi:hypothetical protein
LEIVNVKGGLDVTQCTLQDNGWSGVMVSNASADTAIGECIAARNSQYGISLTNLTAVASNTCTGSIFCDNVLGGLQLTGNVVTVDAPGNWWGNASGPNHPSNPGGIGDSVVDAANGGAGVVDFTPWIDTVTASPADNPVTLGHSVDLSFIFSGGGGAVFLGEGPGDPLGDPPFTLTTDNGTLTGASETGSSIHEFIGENGTLTITLTPGATGKANVSLIGPCTLAGSIAVDVTLNSLELFVQKNSRTGDYTFAAGDTLVLAYEVHPALGGFNDGRVLDAILGVQINPGRTDQVISPPVTGGQLSIYGRRLSGPTPFNSRSIPRAFGGFAFPPSPDPLTGTLNVRIPSGVTGTFAYLGTINNAGKLNMLSGIEVSNQFEIK